LGLLKAKVALPVAGAAVAWTVTLPSTVLFKVTEASPEAFVVAVADDRLPLPVVMAKFTVVPAGTGPPTTLTTLAVTTTGLWAFMKPATGAPLTVTTDGTFGSIKLTVLAGLVTPPADAVTVTVAGDAIPLRLAVATPPTVVVTAEKVAPGVREAKVTTVPSGMAPPGPPLPFVPSGVTVAVSATLVPILAVFAPVTATELGAFGSIHFTWTVLAGSEPTVAVTVKSPFVALVRVTVALPLAFVVVTAERVPPVVVKVTTVPVATGEPLDLRTLAVIVTGGSLTSRDGTEDETVRAAGALGSVGITAVPPPPPPQPTTTSINSDKNRLDRFLTFMIFLAFLEIRTIGESYAFQCIKSSVITIFILLFSNYRTIIKNHILSYIYQCVVQSGQTSNSLQATCQ
jgi:hypothetical protein